jgi:Putative Ig domain
MTVVVLASILAVASGCSDSVSPEAEQTSPAFSAFTDKVAGEEGDVTVSGRDASEDADPIVESVTFEPGVPVSRTRMRAVAKLTGRWTQVEYEWAINGEPYGGSSIEVVLPVLATGDTVSVRVVPIRGQVRGEAMSASATAKNQPPLMLGLSVEYAEDDGGSPGELENWRAVARAEDPDGDSVEFQYRWFVNGTASDVDDELFPAGELARGDRLSVEVRAYDGRAWSPVTSSGDIEVGNAPPTIVSTPPRVDARGQFRYQIKAEDPDGDTKLRFALREAPRGMQIDDINGIVRWEPDTEQAGRHRVEIVVTDEGGAESSQSFSLALVSRSDGEDSVPAAPR